MEDVLSAANEYAGRGWQVFPLKPRSKEPATARGFHDATSNPETIKRRFSGDHPWNIGVRTGIASGVFVLDVDGKDGRESLHTLIATYGRLPETLISTTGSGWHLWFQAVPDMPCSTGRIGNKLDVRADGGYVAAPPSIHPNGRAYRWKNHNPVARAPGWLIDLARRNRNHHRHRQCCRCDQKSSLAPPAPTAKWRSLLRSSGSRWLPEVTVTPR